MYANRSSTRAARSRGRSSLRRGPRRDQVIRDVRGHVRPPVRLGALLRAAGGSNMARLVALALALQATALVPPARRVATTLAATDCGCEVMTGDVPTKAQNMKHRSVVADLPLLTTDGTRTTLKDAATERVAVVAFLRSFG